MLYDNPCNDTILLKSKSTSLDTSFIFLHGMECTIFKSMSTTKKLSHCLFVFAAIQEKSTWIFPPRPIGHWQWLVVLYNSISFPHPLKLDTFYNSQEICAHLYISLARSISPLTRLVSCPCQVTSQFAIVQLSNEILPH